MDSLWKIHALGKAQWMALLDGRLSAVSSVDMRVHGDHFDKVPGGSVLEQELLG